MKITNLVSIEILKDPSEEADRQVLFHFLVQSVVVMVLCL